MGSALDCEQALIWYNYHMDTLIHADVFFFVTTIAVAIVAIVAVAMSFYLVGILRRVRDIAEEVKQETKLVREDVSDARMRMKAGGMHILNFFDIFSGMMGRRSKSKKSKTKV